MRLAPARPRRHCAHRGRTEADLPEGVARISADRDDPDAQTAALSGADYDVVFDISAYTTKQLEPAVEALAGNVGRSSFAAPPRSTAPATPYPSGRTSRCTATPDASQYAKDKIECEDLLNEEFQRGRMPITILRPPYVYGPDNYIAAREFSYFARLSRGRASSSPETASPPFTRFMWTDLADAFVAASRTDGAFGRTFTICSPRRHHRQRLRARDRRRDGRGGRRGARGAARVRRPGRADLSVRVAGSSRLHHRPGPGESRLDAALPHAGWPSR